MISAPVGYKKVIIYLMAHTPFRGGHDTCILADVTRAARCSPLSLYPILRLTPYKGLSG